MGNVELRFNEVSHSRPLRKLVQNNLSRWLQKNSFTGSRDEIAKVEFFKAPFEEKVGCYIEVRKGNTLWRSFEYGKGIQHAFQICLKHLTQNTQWERSAS